MQDYQRALNAIVKATEITTGITKYQSIKFINYIGNLAFINDIRFKNWYKISLENTEHEIVKQNIYIRLGRYSERIKVELIDVHTHRNYFKVYPSQSQIYDVVVEIYYHNPNIVYKIIK